MNGFDVWLPRACFVLALGAAAGLVALVVIAPWVESERPLWTLYAHDVTVRRTSLFAALGLLVTAFVFFRPKRPSQPEARDDAARKVAGA